MNIIGTQQNGSSEFIFAIIGARYRGFEKLGFHCKIVISYCSVIFPNLVFEVVQCSVTELNIKEKRKTREGLISGGGDL